MGRKEKKFQKKKEREREVKKKLLVSRAKKEVKPVEKKQQGLFKDFAPALQSTFYDTGDANLSRTNITLVPSSDFGVIKSEEIRGRNSHVKDF